VRRHVEDLAVDQLRARVGIQDAHLSHPVVLLDGEAVAARPVCRGARHISVLLIVHDANLSLPEYSRFPR